MDAWNAAELAHRLERLTVVEPERAPPRRAAVAVVLALEGAPRVLLMRRATRAGDPWSGQVSLPGGGREPEDPDLRATAVRETREELGVDLARDARYLGRLAPLRARARGALLDMDVSPFVFALDREVVPEVNAEAEEAFWLPLVRVQRGELDHVHLYQDLAGASRELPAWRFEERVVWGMTHRILSELFDAVR
jgi:8-oxo-dGTP pyrophosphatase MutT (NUDIX family)